MFAYNPAVTDRSAEILTSANNQAAAIQLQGMQSLGESMANLGQTFSDSISKARENAAKANTNAGVGEAIADVYRTYGTPEQYKDYLSGLDKVSKNQDKAAGYNAVHVQQAQALVEMKRQQAQYDSALELAKQKQALGLGGGGSTPMYGVEIADGVDIYR